ncbi:sigma-54-dependent transcriptional regulator [Burkholderia seminalis]|uniref:ATPase AAA n=1 Tax=Burkholderia cenocepacia TaxID=95486 RepID=A0A071ME59_9BURK|nr:sigma-54 dependent transcriptional regulator [Burkholderia seminalis]AOJ28876.1 AAA family ATPase [Burkholderia seminalis]KVF52905.1 AAA family ATPase [Burkholderia seminalis]MCA8042592.1 sigma-54 dependent transcriptional regulator [Burkholderia seminalis]QTO20584.1 sigma-54-dependent Fis family transcriptional regulator [Burkholderia seminalis]
MATILLIDDDDAFCEGLSETLTDLGHETLCAGTGEHALARVDRGLQPACIFLDIRLPDMDGIAVLAKLRRVPRLATVPVVVLTAYARSGNTIAAMRLGAFDHLTKPVGRDDIASLLERIFAAHPLSDAAPHAQANVDAFDEPVGAEPRLLGISAAMREVQKCIGRAAASDATVLITGETGTGKEVAARVLHVESSRSAGPFVAVNCAAIPHELLESELFGHCKGAFTGATAARTGRIVEADGGTLFLDEVGDMATSMQAKLLRVLQEQQVTPLGVNRSISVNVRVIAATHRDLRTMVANGTFREDLLYRLNVIPIHLPPLRERLADILPLAVHFLDTTSASTTTKRLSVQAERRLIAYAWPGNVRELRNAIARVNALAPGAVVTGCDLAFLDEPGVPSRDALLPAAMLNRPLSEALAAVEREMILRTLGLTGDNRAEAAKRLGISRQSLYTRMAHLDIG